MRFTLRFKLFAIVAVALVSLLLIIAIGTIAERGMQDEIARIEKRYLPKVEFGPKLELSFEQLTRTFQDAAAAEDEETLAEATLKKDRLLEQLRSARQALGVHDVRDAERAVDAYYTSAFSVTRRLIAGETGEALTERIREMQASATRVTEALRRATLFDRKELTKAFGAIERARNDVEMTRLVVAVTCFIAVALLSLWLMRGILRSLVGLLAGFDRFGREDFSSPIAVHGADELANLATQANMMAENLARLGRARRDHDWIRSGQEGISAALRGELSTEEVTSRAVHFLTEYVGARAAALYMLGANDELTLAAEHAGGEGTFVRSFKRGEGLSGQAALGEELVVLRDLPENYMSVRSGLGAGTPSVLALLPLPLHGRVRGVLELAFFGPWEERTRELLSTVREGLAVAIDLARGREARQKLLEETQRQARLLGDQEQELRANNEELEVQQEELKKSNNELSQQAAELEGQRHALEQANVELERARRTLEEKAEELTSISSYKSRFLANMSHELRTPLNSMLLLSNLLSENQSGNLTEAQVDYCRTVYSAGKDLLALINQVLDLARVEAGRQRVTLGPIPVRHFLQYVDRIFVPLATEKGLGLVARAAPGLADTIITDQKLLEQVINNLIGNAIKFTNHGQIELVIGPTAGDLELTRSGLRADNTFSVMVSDTGVGISLRDRDRIFSPFEQVENESGRYGGTGLGLSIAREIVGLMGGELLLRSEVGKGSTFTCVFPLRPIVETPSDVGQLALRGELGGAIAASGVANGADKDRPILIIEDDPAFGKILSGIVRDFGCMPLVAATGSEGLRLAATEAPRGIVLDVVLPDIDGWAVMNQLRMRADTAKIPVHFVSALDEQSRGLAMGAVGYLTKPATPDELRRVVALLTGGDAGRALRILALDADGSKVQGLVEWLMKEGFEARALERAADALREIRRGSVDCLIVDPDLPDMDVLAFLNELEQINGDKAVRVLIYSTRPLTKQETQRLEAYAEAVVVREGDSAQRLLDELRLFVRHLKDPRNGVRPPTRGTEVRLENRSIVVVDDDMRTVYALSAMLRARGAEVFVADSGVEALKVLKEHPNVDAVLMDIMMPEMDGYTAMRHIRENPRHAKLPIIALTAKAMSGDEQKCLDAGATQYLAKPVDAARLFEALQTHLGAS